MKFFKKNNVSNNIFSGVKKNKNEPIKTVVEYKKTCTIPVYLWKDELKNINKETIMKNLLDYDYYNYALEEKYKTVEDCKKWIFDGDTMMHFRIYEIKVEITYEIETVKYEYDDILKYKEITSIKYLGLCRRVPFEKLGIEKVFGGEKNILFENINDVDKIHKVKPLVYCRNKYFSTTKDCGIDSEFLKEIYKQKIEPVSNNCHSYPMIRNTNSAIYYINKIINENKNASKEMITYKIIKELKMA